MTTAATVSSGRGLHCRPAPSSGSTSVHVNLRNESGDRRAKRNCNRFPGTHRSHAASCGTNIHRPRRHIYVARKNYPFPKDIRSFHSLHFRHASAFLRFLRIKNSSGLVAFYSPFSNANHLADGLCILLPHVIYANSHLFPLLECRN